MIAAGPTGDLDLWDEAVSPHTRVDTVTVVQRDTGPLPAITDADVRAHLCPDCTGQGANLPICHACDRFERQGGAA